MSWDYPTKNYRQQAKRDPQWKLERAINYGLQGKKLDRELLKIYLPRLRIPENRRAFLKLLLWGPQKS